MLSLPNSEDKVIVASMALTFLLTKVRGNYHMGKHQDINWPVNHPEMLLSKGI